MSSSSPRQAVEPVTLLEPTALVSPPSPRSYRNMIALAVAAALVVFAAAAGLDWLLVRESRAIAIGVSDVLTGAFAGGLIFLLLLYQRERRRVIRQRLDTIADMNHHIRNALQVISGTAYSAADQEQLIAIRESVGRIQWALREILPKL